MTTRIQRTKEAFIKRLKSMGYSADEYEPSTGFGQHWLVIYPKDFNYKQQDFVFKTYIGSSELDTRSGLPYVLVPLGPANNQEGAFVFVSEDSRHFPSVPANVCVVHGGFRAVRKNWKVDELDIKLMVNEWYKEDL